MVALSAVGFVVAAVGGSMAAARFLCRWIVDKDWGI